MILVMSSIGASYHDDHTSSSSLYLLAKALLRKHVSAARTPCHPFADPQKTESTPHTIMNEPLWVLQCLLLIMVHGCKSASFKEYQESVSLAPLLIEVRLNNLARIRDRLCEFSIWDLLECSSR